MSLRRAKNKLTGRPTFQPIVTLGYRKDGSHGVTVSVNYDSGYGCYTDPDKIRQFIQDLHAGIKHLEGEDVAALLD